MRSGIYYYHDGDDHAMHVWHQLTRALAIPQLENGSLRHRKIPTLTHNDLIESIMCDFAHRATHFDDPVEAA